MNGAVVKKTQDTLGKVIKKPPLTEKLLCKPPFRYLHDIFSEVIRTTGFMRGLYEDSEMKSDNVKDKDSKIVFLQKALDVVMLVSGEPLAAKPARIVAGHEPERTNELLQAIARCCLSKLSSEEAVKRVLAGDKLDPRGKASASRSQDKENREGGERPRDREERREIRERSGSREHKDPDRPRDQGSHRGDKDRHRDTERSEKPRDRDRTKDRDKDKSRDRERDKDKGREKEREREREKTKERDSHRDREREREKRRDKEKERHKEGEERSRPVEKERHKEGEERTRPVDKGDRKARASEETRPKPHPEEPSKTTKPEQAADSPARIPRPSSAKGQRRRPKPGGPGESDSDGDGDAPLAERPLPQENGDSKDTASPPHLAHSRSVPRPSSARPAPPRVRRQDSHMEGTPADRLSSAKPPAAVIMEGRKLSEDEDDEELFVVEETVPPPPDMPEMELEPAVELRGDEKHGGLVKKILETKKDFESSPSSPKSKEQGVMSEASRRKERELVTREMERVRASIQTLCRSALPLGKIMDYLQEDVDAMQHELLTWRRHNQEHTLALQQEHRVTDSAVEPLKVELQELEQLIREQQDRICTVKSNILKNDDKIHKMVTSINFSSQT